MGDDSSLLDVVEMLGKSTVALCIEMALIEALVEKRLFSIEDATRIFGVASKLLGQTAGLPAESRVLGESALTGFVQKLTNRLMVG